MVESEQTWLTLPDYLGGVGAARRSGDRGRDPHRPDGRRRRDGWCESAVSTYQQSTEFYDAAAEAAAELDATASPRRARPSPSWSPTATTTSAWTGWRARSATARAPTVVLDAGDDTSTGQPWEAFSLDSVSEAFDGYDRFAVLGNHDSGDFVADYLDDLGWEVLDGEVVDGPGGAPLIGVADPRSSGLGNWRDETGLSFAEVGERFSDAICDAEERVATVAGARRQPRPRRPWRPGVPTWSSAATST